RRFSPKKLGSGAIAPDEGGDRRGLLPRSAGGAIGVWAWVGRDHPPGRQGGRGALYVAEMAAACTHSTRGTTPAACQEEARCIVTNAQLGEAIVRARELALGGVSTTEAATACGTTGFVVHTLSFATFCFLRYGHDPLLALTEAISSGGDTDSIAAILGG